MIEPGLVSVIIPVRNRAPMLQEAVASVLAQTYRRFEILICDDGSDDDTPQLGRALADQYPGLVHYRWAENCGAGPARERGRQEARGEYVQYLDSDDSLWPRKFEVQIAALAKNTSAHIAYGWIRLCREGEVPASTPHKWSGREATALFPGLLIDRWWNTNAPLWRRSLTDAIGPWSNLRYSQDWEYDARAGALNARLAYCAEFVTDQRHHAADRQTGTGRWLAPADRVRFFDRLHRCAVAAGVSREDPAMRHFSRWVFRHARECAQLADQQAATELLAIAERAGACRDVRIFRWLAGALGWSRVAHWSEFARRLRGRAAGRDTQRQSWMSPP